MKRRFMLQRANSERPEWGRKLSDRFPNRQAAKQPLKQAACDDASGPKLTVSRNSCKGCFTPQGRL